jgi:hypothetical protein
VRVRLQKPPERRTLIFDSECRPMHYSDWRPESQITAIAWMWDDGRDVMHSELLDRDLANEDRMLERFLAAYDKADLVVGHYIRKHDLPLINDHCVRAGLVPISERGSKLTQDTKMDFVQVKGLGLSQANLAVELGLDSDKFMMSGSEWRRANALDPAGRRLAKLRVEGDVRQNIELYHALQDRGVLRAPKRWPR